MNRIGTAIVVGIGLLAAFAAGTAIVQPERTEFVSSDPPEAERESTLADAARIAAADLPPSTYRTMLANADPLIFSERFRRTTQRFAALLPAEAREEWLWSCFDVACRLARYGEFEAYARLVPRGASLISDEYTPLAAFEAIHNVTKGRTLKTASLARWLAIANVEHAAQTASVIKGLVDPRTLRCPPLPEFPSMPVWDQP